MNNNLKVRKELAKTITDLFISDDGPFFSAKWIKKNVLGDDFKRNDRMEKIKEIFKNQ